MYPGSQESKLHPWVHITQDSQPVKRGDCLAIQHCHGLPVGTVCSKKHTKALEYNLTGSTKLVEELEGLSSEELLKTLGLSALKKRKPEG